MFSDPKSNLGQFGLEKGIKVADLGVGTGFYAIETAKIIGPEGRVFCVDVQKELLAEVGRAAEREGLNNIDTIWGDIEKVEGTKMKAESVDAIIVSNVLFQLENKKGFIEETARILKPEGRVLVIDWMDSFAGIGPAPNHIVKQEEAESLFKQSGFKIDRQISAGDRHYGFIARKTIK